MTGQQRAPLCPACGAQMNIARVTARAYGRYRLITYGCEACGVAYTEGEPDAEKPGPVSERE